MNQCCEHSQVTRCMTGLGSEERWGSFRLASGFTDLSGTRWSFNRPFKLFPLVLLQLLVLAATQAL